MLRRRLSAETVAALNASRLWQNIIADRELLPEIRDEHLTVYYRGGALLKGLRANGRYLEAQIHRKFIPVSRCGRSDYLIVRGDSAVGLRFTGGVEPLPLGLGEPDVLDSYKTAMDQVLSDFPEGRLVHRIATRSENLTLDQEITFAESGENRDKVDLCYFDTDLQKLVFVEVKRVEDGRLFQTADRPEVLNQLAAYCRRLVHNRDEILDAYRTVVALKHALGLGARLAGVPLDGPADLLERPLLVIGGCSREERSRIRTAEGAWGPLMGEIGNVAAGVIACGDDGCKLLVADTPHSLRFR